MSTNTHRQQLESQIAARWGQDRIPADEATLESACAALDRLDALQPAATIDLDTEKEHSRV